MYKIQLTGILNDKWFIARTFATRKEAQSYAHFLMTDKWVNRFDSGRRAAFKSVQVMPA